MWVWYPSKDSRVKSFHQSILIKMRKNIETKTLINDNFRLIYKTILAMKENKLNETNRGQKEDWIGKKGLKNIIN